MENQNAVLEQPPVSPSTPPIAPVPLAPARPQQMGLIGFVDDAIGKAFAPKIIKNSKGEDVGTSVTMKSRKDIAAAVGIANSKDNKGVLDRKILSLSDEAFLKVKAEIAGLGADWTLAKVQQRTLGNGVRQISVVVKEVKRNHGPSDEEIAKSLGWTVEQVVATRKRQTEALERQNIDLPGESKPDETKPDKDAAPAETAEEKQAREEAELADEIAAEEAAKK